MMQISPTIVPATISKSLTVALKAVVKNPQPKLVDVRPLLGSHPNKCTFNVKKMLEQKGGEIEFGWYVSVWPNVLVDCIGHAVHSDGNGNSICVTPEKEGNVRILFLPDFNLSFDFDDLSARMPHRMIPLRKDPDIYNLIANQQRELEIRCKYPRGSQLLMVQGEDAIELQSLENQKIELVRRILLKTKHHNEPCVCGSGRKFRKCCRSQMLTVGSLGSS